MFIKQLHQEERGVKLFHLTAGSITVVDQGLPVVIQDLNATGNMKQQGPEKCLASVPVTSECANVID